MNRVLILIAFLSFSIPSKALEDFYKSADEFFKTYVIEGKVNYKAVKMNGSGKLETYVISPEKTWPFLIVLK